MKTKQKSRLYKGRIDTNDAEFGMINRATLHELSLRIPERNVTARMVYVLLLTYANDKGKCWPSQSTLAKILNVNRDAVVNAYKTLRELGFIKTKKNPATKSLKVQIYSVHHKLIFPDAHSHKQDDVDDFPDTEENFSLPNFDSRDNDKKTCMPEHTSKSMDENTGVCMPETNSGIPVNTQTKQVTDQTNRPVENTTPPQAHLSVCLNPPLEDSKSSRVKPSIPLDDSDIMDIYEYGKKFPVLDAIEDDFIKEQIPQIQCMFTYIKEWNVYWGFDASELSFTEKDVDKAAELLSFNSYDEIMDDFQYLAEWLDKPKKAVDFSYFWGYLLDGAYQDS